MPAAHRTPSPENHDQTRSPLAVRIREACRLIGLGRSTVYELIAAGELEMIKVGAATLIPMDSLERLVADKRQSSCVGLKRDGDR